MSKSFPQRRFEPSAEVLAAAKTRLPLRLPPPEATGPRRAVQRLDRGADATPRPEDDLDRRRFVPAISSGLERPAPVGSLSAVETFAGGRSVNSQPTDAQLEDYAQQALYRTGICSFSRLWVEVRQQRAVVFGTLQDDFELPLALQTVRRVNGILSVEHRIQVVRSQGDDQVVLSARSGGKQRSVTGWLAWAAQCVLSGWFGRRALMLGGDRRLVQRGIR